MKLSEPDNRLKLYIICSHVDKPLEQAPPASVYDCPIQAGAALTDKRICELNDHDDFPESISDRNRRYCEMTALWWIGHHIDTPYVGAVHYRRRLKLTDEELAACMDEDVDVITSIPILVPRSLEESYRSQQRSTDWDLLMETIREYAPQDMALAEECFAGNVLHNCNINIFKGGLYREYCEWLFPMLDAFYRRSPEKTDVFQHRDVGFISESLSHLFVTKQERQGKKVRQAELVDLKSVDWGAEKECDLCDWAAVWDACDQLYRQRQITKCQRLLGEAVHRGGLQDERLKLLYDTLVTGIVEGREQPLTMHEYLPQEFRGDLDTLTAAYDGFRRIVLLWHERDDDETAKLLSDYMKLTHFSTIAVSYIIDQAEKERVMGS
ncbi:MAG: DUF4422 domain-containing protein [Lachnospiraceae bacterium]|nr:DUF4422 domain-containing protein [Lachnospiraceae bacterium]